MLDFWELLGRVVAEDSFRADMIAFDNARPNADQSCTCRVVFNPPDFDGMRAVVATAHPEIPVSLAALGEWMLIKSIAPVGNLLADVAAVVKPAVAASPTTDRQFFQALGLSVIDQTFGDAFDETHTFGFALQPPDIATIKTLNADQAGFRAKCLTFHNTFWTDDCKSWMFASGSSPILHLHLLDPDEQTLFNKLN